MEIDRRVDKREVGIVVVTVRQTTRRLLLNKNYFTRRSRNGGFRDALIALTDRTVEHFTNTHLEGLKATSKLRRGALERKRSGILLFSFIFLRGVLAKLLPQKKT